ncbi:MAG: hypothetical protein HY228_01015 [Candidatus Yonathbacteria bacterium]|nr:hypothetical protein [Candidatus Yonathbacteria bacterium]
MRFDEVVEERIRNIVDKENLRSVLELPRVDFGVGLSPHRAREISDRLESILEERHFQVLH